MIRRLDIPAAAYEALSARERVTAYLAAERRNDTDEAKRLVETCQRKTYRQPDAAFVDFLDRLKTAALGVESELQRAALDFLMASRMDAAEGGEVMDDALETAASTVAAWRQVLAEHDLDPADVEAVGPPRHPAVNVVLQMAEPVPEIVEQIAESLRALFAPVSEAGNRQG